MSSLIRRRKARICLTVSSDSARTEAFVAREKIRLLKDTVRELQRELESLTQVPTPEIEQGVDFYTEVSRFESEMIRRALTFADGHQVLAARLLNLNTTTLSAMIKRYCIQIDRPRIQ
jgi:transcriptional regulator with GAF, ATPase, and Fis domain